jgi:thymidylate kinase
MSRTCGRIVAIVGVDGVGKSTLAASLEEELRCMGMAVRLEWCGFQDWFVLGHVARGLRRILRLVPRIKSSQHSSGQLYDANRSIFRNRVARICYYGAVAVDHTIQLIVKVGFSKKNGFLVLCDRYYLDQAISISTELESRRAHLLFITLYDAILPRPDIVLFVTAPSTVSMNRKSDIPSEEYLERRAELYPSGIRRYPHIEIDGRREVSQNTDLVTDALVARNLISRRSPKT